MWNQAAIQAIAVDYYGTLVDSGRPFDSIRAWFADTYSAQSVDSNRLFLSFSKERAKRRYDGKFRLGYELLIESYEAACRRFQIPPYTEAFYTRLASLFTEPPVYEGALQLVAAWRKRYPVLLLTNADNRFLYPSIHRHGFAFDFIVSSEDMQSNKPEPALFRQACELLGLPAEHIVMIGDSLTEDIQGAINGGMQALWIHKKGDCNKDLNALPVKQVASLQDIYTVL